MKILFVSNLYPPDTFGGYEILCEYVTGELCKRGHQCTILSTCNGTDVVPENYLSVGNHGEKVIRGLKLWAPFGTPPHKTLGMHLAIEKNNRACTQKVIVDEQPDIIFHWSLRRLSLGSVRAAMESGVKYGFTLNDDYLNGYKPGRFELSFRRIARLILEKSIGRNTTYSDIIFKNVTGISRSLLNSEASKNAGVSDGTVIYQGIDDKNFPIKETPGSLHSPIRILYAGQVHKYKGVHTLLESTHLLKTEGYDVSVSIAGTGDAEYAAELRSYVEQNGIDENVCFLGRVDRKRLADLYRKNDIFVFTSIWNEPFGLTHLEAMSSGLPVVSTTMGGPGEFLENEINALTFKADDPADLTVQIKKLINDEDLRLRISLAGRDCVLKKFTTDRYVNDLEKFLLAAVN